VAGEQEAVRAARREAFISAIRRQSNRTSMRRGTKSAPPRSGAPAAARAAGPSPRAVRLLRSRSLRRGGLRCRRPSTCTHSAAHTAAAPALSLIHRCLPARPTSPVHGLGVVVVCPSCIATRQLTNIQAAETYRRNQNSSDDGTNNRQVLLVFWISSLDRTS
jgi:hypothetical protein